MLDFTPPPPSPPSPIHQELLVQTSDWKDKRSGAEDTLFELRVLNYCQRSELGAQIKAFVIN